jgi:hypothetical protein
VRPQRGKMKKNNDKIAVRLNSVCSVLLRWLCYMISCCQPIQRLGQHSSTVYLQWTCSVWELNIMLLSRKKLIFSVILPSVPQCQLDRYRAKRLESSLSDTSWVFKLIYMYIMWLNCHICRKTSGQLLMPWEEERYVPSPVKL